MARIVSTILGVLIGGATGGVCGILVYVAASTQLRVAASILQVPPWRLMQYAVVGEYAAIGGGAIWGAMAMGRAIWRTGPKPLLGILLGTAVLAVTGLPLYFLVMTPGAGEILLWPGVCLLASEVLLLRWFANLRAWQLLASITLFFFILCPVMVMHFEATQGQTHPPAGLIAVVLAIELWGILAGAALAAEAIYWVYNHLKQRDDDGF